MAFVSQIPAPSQRFVDADGTVTVPWFQFLMRLYRAIIAGTGAPVDVEYVVGAPNGSLPNARVPTDTPSVDFDMATAGLLRAHVRVDPSGALDGGTLADLAVRVDGVTVQINGSNQLTAPGGGGGGVTVDPAGALDGDGTVGAPLAVRVDGVTIQIDGSNQLTAPASPPVTITGTVGGGFDGAGAVLPAGLQATVFVPYAHTIVGVVMFADQVGSLVVDVWRDTFANYPATGADSIVGAAPPTISGVDKSMDTTLTGWSTAGAANTTYTFTVTSATAIEWATVQLITERV